MDYASWQVRRREQDLGDLIRMRLIHALQLIEQGRDCYPNGPAKDTSNVGCWWAGLIRIGRRLDGHV
jgi:hypothetical protein